jgi:predicted metalloendopeptidase
MRFVLSAPNATVFYDFEYEEFVVQFYCNGVLVPDADYFTDDQSDAVETAFSFQTD